MSRRNSTVSNASSVTADDNTHTIYAYHYVLNKFSSHPSLASYSDYKFYMCWGGGPVGGFINKYDTWYKINQNSMGDDYEIEKLRNVEIDIDYDYSELIKKPLTLTVRDMPSIKVTKSQFYKTLYNKFSNSIEDFNPRIYHDYQVIIEIRPCDTITKWVNDWIKMFNWNNTELNLNVELHQIKSDCYVLSYDSIEIEWPETNSDEAVEFEYEFQNDFVLSC